jgi:hypothetical protein
MQPMDFGVVPFSFGITTDLNIMEYFLKDAHFKPDVSSHISQTGSEGNRSSDVAHICKSNPFKGICLEVPPLLSDLMKN